MEYISKKILPKLGLEIMSEYKHRDNIIAKLRAKELEFTDKGHFNIRFFYESVEKAEVEGEEVESYVPWGELVVSSKYGHSLSEETHTKLQEIMELVEQEFEKYIFND